MGSERCLSTLGLSFSRGCDRVGLKFKLFLLHSHHDRSIRERVVTLVEEGGLSASTAGELYGVPSLLQEHGYRYTRGMGKLEGAEELVFGAYPA
jgi:hypothetical protein